MPGEGFSSCQSHPKKPPKRTSKNKSIPPSKNNPTEFLVEKNSEIPPTFFGFPPLKSKIPPLSTTTEQYNTMAAPHPGPWWNFRTPKHVSSDRTVGRHCRVPEVVWCRLCLNFSIRVFHLVLFLFFYCFSCLLLQCIALEFSHSCIVLAVLAQACASTAKITLGHSSRFSQVCLPSWDTANARRMLHV